MSKWAKRFYKFMKSKIKAIQNNNVTLGKCQIQVLEMNKRNKSYLVLNEALINEIYKTVF